MRNLAFLAQGFNKVSEGDSKTVVLPQVIIESAMFFQEDGKNKNIEIRLLDRATQNRVSGHPELLRQALMNIFDNCVKYSEPGYDIEVNQWIQRNTSNAMISIKNRSRYPVDPAEIEKIFELGYRGGNAKKVVASGTGLGLYICKRIIEDVHTGTIRAQAVGRSEIEFVIKLPSGQRP
jgi:signal transduction histidine kinase